MGIVQLGMAARLTRGLLVVVLVATGCGGGEPDAGGPIWGRTFLSTAVTEHGQARPLVAGTQIRLAFNDGQVQADAGCNHLSGRVSPESGRLVVSDLGGTAMGCDGALHGQDDWLAGFLTGRPSWRLDGDALVLGTGDIEMRFIDSRSANPDRALAGTRWVVESLIDHQTVSSVPAGANAYLVFRDGDRVEGSTGCNTFHGTAARRADKIAFSGIVATKMACPAQVDRLDESAVLAVLDGEVTPHVQGDRLTLTHPGGRGLGLRAEP